MENQTNNNSSTSGILSLVDRYPRILAWVVLSVGIIALLVYEARDIDLTATNWLALVIASIAVSGLCIWIVSWEDEDEQESLAENAELAEPASSPTPQKAEE